MPPNSINRKKKRNVEYLETIQHKFYIFCEGEKTEPQYFLKFRDIIKENPIYKSLVQIHIEGLGADTLRIINAAEEYVTKNKIKNAQIWCVYDKDSFPDSHFNAVSDRADKLNQSQDQVKYCVAWSNQCIEYWFILHFDFYVSNNDRKYYISYLTKKYKEKNLGKYLKNNSNNFDILLKYGDPKAAMNRAVKRINECNSLTDSCSAPATKVHLLVCELAVFLPPEIKNRFI